MFFFWIITAWDSRQLWLPAASTALWFNCSKRSAVILAERSWNPSLGFETPLDQPRACWHGCRSGCLSCPSQVAPPTPHAPPRAIPSLLAPQESHSSLPPSWDDWEKLIISIRCGASISSAPAAPLYQLSQLISSDWIFTPPPSRPLTPITPVQPPHPLIFDCWQARCRRCFS